MSIYTNISEKNSINLAKIAEQQKNQKEERNKMRILKQTHDVQIVESIRPITETLTQTSKEPDVDDGKTQTPSIQNNRQSIITWYLNSYEEPELIQLKSF